MRNHFWERWSKEYLLQVQARAKWLHPNHSFREGDLVLIKDELMPIAKWPLAVIKHLYTGPDGLSRVAMVKTATTQLKRPIARLILLPVNDRAAAHLVQVLCAMVSSAADSER